MKTLRADDAASQPKENIGNLFQHDLTIIARNLNSNKIAINVDQTVSLTNIIACRDESAALTSPEQNIFNALNRRSIFEKH